MNEALPIADVQGILTSEPAVTAIAGENICMTQKGQAAKPPFVAWICYSNVPQLVLGDRPPVDAQAFQVDCYSRDQDEAMRLAFACRDALEAVATVGRGPLDMGMEAASKLYRWTLDAAFIWKRKP